MDKITFKEDNKFSVCGGWKGLVHGYEAKIDVSIYPSRENLTDEIQRLVKLSNIDELLEQAKQEEERVYFEIYQEMEKWLEKAKTTRIYQLAKEYQKEVENLNNKIHTYNKWVEDEYGRNKISNNVYVMYYEIYETKDYNHRTGKKEEVFYVTWNVCINGVNSKRIAGQNHKRYTDKNKALKYIEGRIKAYSHLFQEITPEIPTEYEDLFMKNGILLEGYKVAN